MNETPDNERPTLVLGGTGKTGRRVVAAAPRPGSARPRGFPFGTAGLRLGRPVHLGAGAAGALGRSTSPIPTWSSPIRRTEATRAFAELAIEHGVDRLVLLTGRGEDEAQRAEQEVQATGADVDHRALRLVHAELQRGLPAGRRSGPARWRCPAGERRLEPFVDADDIADVAVAALTEPGHAGQVYELTGPRLLSFPEAVAEIAKANGRDITYVQVSVQEYAAGAAEHGIPGEFVDFLTYLFSDVVGGGAFVTDGVQRALGREPRSFRDFAERTAATGVWS